MTKAQGRSIPGVNIPSCPDQGAKPRFQTVFAAFRIPQILDRVAGAGEVVFLTAILSVSVLLLAMLPWQTVWAANTKIYMQPAFWPAIGVGLMVVFAAAALLTALMSRPSSGLVSELTVWLRGGEFVLWFMVYVWLVPRLGYLAMTMAFCCALAWREGYRSRPWMAISAVFGFGVVVIFKGLLGVNIPAGQIYDLLPPGAVRSFIMTHL